jgi:hypothetical protein
MRWMTCGGEPPFYANSKTISGRARAGTLPTALLAIGALASGCSDHKNASDANFRSVLEPVVRDAFCQTIDLPIMVANGHADDAVFPLTVPAKPPMFGSTTYASMVAMLDDASRAGLLKRTAAEMPARERGVSLPATRQSVVTYAPTEKAAPYFRSVDRKTGVGMLPFPAVCAAKGELVDVTRWTEPADFGGRRVSQVTYRFKGVEPLSIVPDGDKARMAQPREATLPLVLESDGWRVMPR